MRDSEITIHHVLVVALSGGLDETEAQDLARGLAGLDVRVTLVLGGSEGSRLEASSGVIVRRCAHVGEDELASLALALSPDIVHVFDERTALMPWRVPLVLTTDRPGGLASQRADLLVIAAGGGPRVLRQSTGETTILNPNSEEFAWSMLCAYQELKQAAAMDIQAGDFGSAMLI